MCFINFAGLPPYTLFDGILLTTTLPAATTTLSPMITPGRIIAPYPMKTLSPIIIFFDMRT